MDINGFREPVLVRVRERHTLDAQARQSFVVAANRAATWLSRLLNARWPDARALNANVLALLP